MKRTIQGLSRKEIDTFHREGYLVVDKALAEADLQPVIEGGVVAFYGPGERGPIDADRGAEF